MYNLMQSTATTVANPIVNPLIYNFNSNSLSKNSNSQEIIARQLAIQPQIQSNLLHQSATTSTSTVIIKNHQFKFNNTTLSVPQQQQHHHYNQQFDTKPNWSITNNTTKTIESIKLLPKETSENDDDHFNRHIENINKSDEDDDHLKLVGEKEEINELKLEKLINKNKTTNQSQAKDEDDVINEDEFKVFQVEEDDECVDNCKRSKTPTPLTPQQQTVVSKPSTVAKPMLDSVMPTPLAYSRSSSLTSLNSFSDVKSVHSSVASEYSSRVKKNKNNDDQIEIGDLDDTQRDFDDIDILMPDSPLAQADSSFLMTQRIKHKQQQLFYRQSAQASMVVTTSSTSSSTATINQPTEAIKDQQPILIKPWSTNNNTNREINNLMTNLNINKPSAFLNSETKEISAISNTPPVKLLSSIAPKFVQNIVNPPLLMQSQSNIISNNSCQQPTIPSAPMAVTYAFMKNSLSSSCSTATTVQPNYPATVPNNPTPKFLMSSASVNYVNNTTNVNKQTIFPLTNVTVQPCSTLSTIPSTSNNNNNQSPTSSQYSTSEEMPQVYSNENRAVFNLAQQLCPSSPPESVCSRMSDSSIPSLIRQDININKTKFQNIINQPFPNNTTTTTNSHPSNDFKALFSKLCNNKTVNQHTSFQQFNNKPIPILATLNNNLNNNPNRNMLLDDEEERPKNFLNEEENYEDEPPLLNSYSNSNISNKPLFLKSVNFYNNNNNNNIGQQPKIYAFNSNNQPNYGFQQNTQQINQYPIQSQKISQPMPNHESEEVEDEEDNSLCQNKTSNDLNNITTKQMNTPAGFCSLSGASFIDVESDEENDKSIVENNKKTVKNMNNSNNIDLDLENFINEMLPQVTSKQLSPTESVKTNISLNNGKGISSRLFKRASLQNIDIASSSKGKPTISLQQQQSKRLSTCSNDERVKISLTASKPSGKSVNVVQSKYLPKNKISDDNIKTNQSSVKTATSSNKNISSIKTNMTSSKPNKTTTSSTYLKQTVINTNNNVAKSSLSKGPKIGVSKTSNTILSTTDNMKKQPTPNKLISSSTTKTKTNITTSKPAPANTTLIRSALNPKTSSLVKQSVQDKLNQSNQDIGSSSLLNRHAHLNDERRNSLCFGSSKISNPLVSSKKPIQTLSNNITKTKSTGITSTRNSSSITTKITRPMTNLKTKPLPIK